MKLIINRLYKKAIIHSITSYGGYYLRWIDDGWATRNASTDRAHMVSSQPWYTAQLYVIYILQII